MKWRGVPKGETTGQERKKNPDDKDKERERGGPTNSGRDKHRYAKREIENRNFVIT